MKKLGILVVLMVLMYSCCVAPDDGIHFVDEKFVLIEKEEKEMVVNGDTKNVRFWKIQRVITINDSIFVADIDDSGCNCGIITDEVWYNREVGDVLYFEYIRKDRFYKVKNLAEVERKILEKERNIMSLEREIESLKESLK